MRAPADEAERSIRECCCCASRRRASTEDPHAETGGGARQTVQADAPREIGELRFEEFRHRAP